MKDLSNFKKVPVKELISTDGKDVVQIYRNRWWIVTPDECVLFYADVSPQCNPSKIIAEKLQKRLYPNCECRLIELAFVPWND